MTSSAQIATDKALPAPKASASSYGQILKSSSIIGGAQAVTLVIGMLRTKLVAILLGPSGVGLVGLFQSATSMVGTVAGLGIAQSAVRQVAEAHGSQDQQKIARTIKVLRRVCWVTGALGWFLAAALAYPLSLWTFNDPGRAWAVAVLGATLFIGSISSGQSALLQGVRRIGDLARLQILGAVASTVVCVGLYAWLGERGIVPVLLATSLVSLGFSWWLARRVAVPSVDISWAVTARESRRFVSLGLAFMWSGLLTAGVALVTQSLIARKLGVDANGIYQAAWAISGVFAGFILNAMGTDFYPRLTAAASDNEQVNRLVNEQTEVGVLLALPGLLATLIFSPWVIRVLYTTKFLPAADLLPWFVLGIAGRVVSWPLAFIQLAKGASRLFALTETAFNVLHIALIWFGLKWFGLKGVAVAFACLYACYILGMLWFAHRLSGFRWAESAIRLLGTMAFLILTAFALRLAPPIPSAALGAFLVLGSAIYSVRQLTSRLGPQHRISRLIAELPLIGRFLAA